MSTPPNPQPIRPLYNPVKPDYVSMGCEAYRPDYEPYIKFDKLRLAGWLLMAFGAGMACSALLLMAGL